MERLEFLEKENIRLGEDLCRTNDRVYRLEQLIGIKEIPIPVTHAIHELRNVCFDLREMINERADSP